MVAVGVVLEGISTAITGIRSTQEEGSKKTTLLAASATVGFGTIMFVISLVLLFMFQVKSKVKPSKGLAIAALVFGILGILLFIVGAVIAGVQSTKYDDDLTVKNALRTAAILVAIGILHLLIGYTILYIVIGKKINRFSRVAKRA